LTSQLPAAPDVRILIKYRLVEAVNFETDEALLTGESLPVRRDPTILLDDDAGLGDRMNVAYSSSTVTKGRARGIVFATGLNPEIGSIAAALRATGSKVEFQAINAHYIGEDSKPHKALIALA
jgi:magnesium-transporting ATPase (P-type)